MNSRAVRSTTSTVLGACFVALLQAAAPPAVQGQGLDPFSCTGQAFVVQLPEAQLFLIDQAITPFLFEPVGDNPNSTCDAGTPEPCNLLDAPFSMMGDPIQVNNMGFRRNDGLLYAVLRNGNANMGILRIGDPLPMAEAGTNVEFFSVAGLPTNIGFDAGDVSVDGTTMYINQAGIGSLYRVDLTPLDSAMAPTLIDSAVLSGGAGTVNDWAAHPDDGTAAGSLWGGDQTGGQVVRLDLNTFGMGGNVTRLDITPMGCSPIVSNANCTMGEPPEVCCDAGGTPGTCCDVNSLPTGTGFGGAWFNPSGDLFLYQNEGRIFRIALDLTDQMNPTAQIISTQDGQDSEGNNDGAACIPEPPYGVAKEMTADPTDALPSTVTIQYVFENLGSLSPAEDLSNLSAIDDLAAVFGVPGVDWTFTSISSMPADFANPNFNGGDDTMGPADAEMVNQMPTQSLLAGETKTMTVVLEVLTLDNTNPPPFTFCNQVIAEAENSSGVIIGDLSTDGGDPDPDGNGFPDESELTCIDIVPPPPSLLLTKTGALDLGPDGIANPGDVIDYTFEVMNGGGVTVTDILVSDSLVSPITCPSGNPIPSLDPGESETCTGSYVITQADIDNCSVLNDASADGMDPAGAPVSATDDHTEPIPPAPDVLIEKMGTVDDGGDNSDDVGDVIDYVFTVTNTGNVTLMNVSVTDPIVAPITCPSGNPIPTMAPGDVEICTGSYVITQADVDAGERCNTATATGTQPTACGPGTASDEVTICIPIMGRPPVIPTLGHLGLLLLALGLAGLGVRQLRPKR